MISSVVDYLLWLLSVSWRFTVNFVKRRPFESALIGIAIIRSFGTLIHSGQAGVLFFCGRVRKVLEPGFYPLIPVLHHVRKLPIRSVTLDLPRQRIATADGLVFDVDTSIVYRTEDPVKAVTLVDNLTRAITNVVPLVVQEVLREHTRAELADRQALDHEITERCRQRLSAWGLTVEQAGLSSIAPTRRTVRLSQLRSRVLERRRLFEQMTDTNEQVAILLASAGPAPLGHAANRYRIHRRARVLQRRQALRQPSPQPTAPPTLDDILAGKPPAPAPAPPAAGDHRR